MQGSPSYPIGKFEAPVHFDASTRAHAVDAIEKAPAQLRRAVEGLTDAQLDTAYRDGGWTVRQVVHHVADSHVNAYVRYKLALTEDEPTVKTYEEALWAEIPEARTAPVEMSLRLLDALHARWTAALRGTPPEAFRRTYRHPEHGLVTLDYLVALYAWHGRHHAAQVESLRHREGWSAAAR